jgi:hypothetical protein
LSLRDRRSLSPSPDENIRLRQAGDDEAAETSAEKAEADPRVPQLDGESRPVLAEHGIHSLPFNSSPSQPQERASNANEFHQGTLSPTEWAMQQIRGNYEQFLKDKREKEKEGRKRHEEDEQAMSQVFLTDSSSEANCDSVSSSTTF